MCDSTGFLLQQRLNHWNQQLSADGNIDYQPLVDLVMTLDDYQLQLHFSRVLPLSLRLLDHHHLPNKQLGMTCISFLISHVPKSLLRETGSDQLLIFSLKSCLAHEDMVLSVMPVLIGTMRRFGTDPLSSTADDVLLTIVNGLDLSSSPGSKLIYWKSLKLVIDFVGVSIARLIKRIIHRMTDHLSYPLSEESDQMFCSLLLCARSLVKAVPDRCHRFSAELLFAVLSFCFSNYKSVQSSHQIRLALRSLLRAIASADPSAWRHVRQVIAKNDPQNRLSFLLPLHNVNRLEPMAQTSASESSAHDDVEHKEEEEDDDDEPFHRLLRQFND